MTESTLAQMEMDFGFLTETQFVVLIVISTVVAIIAGWVTGSAEGRFAGMVASAIAFGCVFLFGFVLINACR